MVSAKFDAAEGAQKLRAIEEEARVVEDRPRYATEQAVAAA